jgi:hypothetical protein
VVGVFGSLVDVALHPEDFAGELAVSLAVVVADGCRGVAANVGCLVSREDHGDCSVHAPLADLLPVEVERRGAALADAAAVVGELHPHLVLAGGDRAVARRS